MDPDLQMLLGNPSGATTDTLNTGNFLIRQPQLAEGYSDTHRIPLWVSWHLAPPDLGTASRSTKFYAALFMPPNFHMVSSGDYTGSGYDRGHNCPSADRTATEADNKAVFYMTNIMPQASGNNGGPWGALESYCRSQVSDAGKECYIITSWSGVAGSIDDGNITVPKDLHKIVVILPLQDGDDRARIRADTTIIAVTMPNVDEVLGTPWQNYVTTVRAIEAATGLNFLSSLPQDVQDALEIKVFGQTTTPTPTATQPPAPTASATPSPSPSPSWSPSPSPAPMRHGLLVVY